MLPPKRPAPRPFDVGKGFFVYMRTWLAAAGLVWWAQGPAGAQTAPLDTTLVLVPPVTFLGDSVEVTVRIQDPAWTAGKDSFYLWSFNDLWTPLGSQQIAIKKHFRDVAYKNAQWNPAIHVLTDEVDREIAVYFWCARDPGNYEITLLFRKFTLATSDKARLTLYYLKGDYWEEITGQLDSVAITRTGFYAVFDKQPPAAAPVYGITSFPNPFDPFEDKGCHISYVLQTDSEVTVRVFTKYGEEVFSTTCQPGTEGGIGSQAGAYLNRVFWDGRNRKGRIVDNGGYLCQIAVKGKDPRYWTIGVRR